MGRQEEPAARACPCAGQQVDTLIDHWWINKHHDDDDDDDDDDVYSRRSLYDLMLAWAVRRNQQLELPVLPVPASRYRLID